LSAARAKAEPVNSPDSRLRVRPQVARLHHLSVANPGVRAQEDNPALRLGVVQKASRLRHLKAVNDKANRAPERHRIFSLRLQRQNRVGRQGASWARVQFRVQLAIKRMLRDKVVAEDLQARDSALLRQRVGLDTSGVLLNIDRRRRH
jgi:hypothetical protein